MSYRFIPTKVHGALDYIIAIALIFAPIIFGFQSLGGPAVAVPITLGVILFLYSLLTNYGWGVIRVFGVSYHLVLDVIAGILLLISPVLFGFSDEAVNAWLPHVVVGIAIVVIVLFSQREPERPEIRSM